MLDGKPWILGIASSHNGAACLLHGSRIVVAIQEERLLRHKRAEHPAAFPSLSVAYCLEHAGIASKNLDAVVLCASASTKQRSEDIYLNWQLQAARNGLKVFTIPHHFGHAIAVHALSGMTSGAVLIIDGNGSPWDELLEVERAAIVPGQLEAVDRPGRTIPRENISLYIANEGLLTPIEKHVASYENEPQPSPGLQEFRSLGDMYGFVGGQIFDSFLEGPGKVMGLAPFGKPTIPVEEFYRITELGFEFQDAVRKRFTHDDRWPLRKEEYENLAASVQKALEEAVLTLCRRLRYEHENLCYAGGVALNSVANERIVREAGFQDVFIMPAAEDSGTAIGAAYHGLWQLCGFIKTERQELDNVGHPYTESEISVTVKQLPGLSATRSSEVVEAAADLLLNGKIVGWFQGGSELGPRSLGQRSILCDPRLPEMKDILNCRVKFREGFRPFAPIIPEEDIYDWFEVCRPHGDSPFMLRVLPFRREQAARVPAVVHVDGTGRVQTVSRRAYPQLHRLLTTFKRETGIPVLLNTSFNISGEPIVETPADALWCFLYTDMDYCVLGDYLVSKTDGVDLVLEYPLSISAQAVALYAEPVKGRVHFPIECLCDAEERSLSGHLSRIQDVSAIARSHRWLRLLVFVNTPWGEVVHGLPGEMMQILKLVDGHRTGKEIYAQVLADGSCWSDPDGTGRGHSSCPRYLLSQFRRHLGLLKRIGAIGYEVQRKERASH